MSNFQAISKIDNTDYDLNTLSDEAKAQLTSLQFADAELKCLHAKIAVYQTARAAYDKALSEPPPRVKQKSRND